MSSRYLKFIISCVVYIWTSACRLVLRLTGQSLRPGCVILYYHSVSWEVRNRFAKQMDALKRCATPIRLEHRQAITSGHRYAAVTFDDVFEDVIENAIPELVAREIPATLFVTAGTMGQLAAWWPASSSEHQKRLAGLDQLSALPEDSVYIAAHTMTHPRLSLLDGDEACREIVESRNVLEEKLQRRVSEMSFPYGDFNAGLVQICKEAGYERVYTTEHKDASNVYDAFVIGRVNADPTDWPLEFWLKLHGAYAWLPRAIRWKRALKRLLGRGQTPAENTCASS